jgi:hypothetical protein
MRKKDTQENYSLLRLLTCYVKCVMRFYIELYSEALYDVFVMKCLTTRGTFCIAHFPLLNCCVNSTICMQETTEY